MVPRPSSQAPWEVILQSHENRGDPAYPSYVVTTCHKMRRKPLRLLSAEEIRRAISQEIGVAFLVPMAIERLQTNPLA